MRGGFSRSLIAFFCSHSGSFYFAISLATSSSAQQPKAMRPPGAWHSSFRQSNSDEAFDHRTGRLADESALVLQCNTQGATLPFFLLILICVMNSALFSRKMASSPPEYLFSGVRPSSGAAASKSRTAPGKSDARDFLSLLPPEDGRTPQNRYVREERISQTRPQPNCSFVVAASGSHPREGLLLIDDTSLMEIWRPRVLGPLTSTSAGLQVC